MSLLVLAERPMITTGVTDLLAGTACDAPPLQSIASERIARDGTEQNLCVERRDERLDFVGQGQQAERPKVIGSMRQVAGRR
jgi:hypothetical protein